ncbi:MAG: hypothetical protein IPK87_00795 [Planctomycetes bacterium]|nr:hypothetical protein [Planctomycetota bacterium]
MIDQGDIATFSRFVHRAEGMLRSGSMEPPVASFQAFIEQVTPLAIGEVRKQFERLRSMANQLATWWTEHDLVSVLGVRHAEDPYSELLAWMIRRETHPPSFETRVGTVLALVSPELAGRAGDVKEIRTQVATPGGGVPDIVIRLSDTAAIIEAKTGTGEHVTPAGRMQTVGYPDAVQQLFGLPNKPKIAFLTLDRTAAENPEATLLTWADCAAALAKALFKKDVDTTFGAILSVGITHFVRACLSVNADALLAEVMSGGTGRWTDARILQRMAEIEELYSRLEAAL